MDVSTWAREMSDETRDVGGEIVSVDELQEWSRLDWIEAGVGEETWQDEIAEVS